MTTVLRLLLCLCLAGPVLAAPVRMADILAAFDQLPLDTSRLQAARQILEAPVPETTEPAERSKAHWERGRAAAELGLPARQLVEMRRALELGGGGNPGRLWREIAQAEFQMGNFRGAIEARLKALSLTPDNMRGRQLSEHTGLADLYRRIGDFETARKHVRDAEGLLVLLRRGRAWDQYQNNWQGSVEDALGRIEFAAGRYVEAEARFRKAIEFMERDLLLNPQRLAQGMETAPQFQLENYRDALEAWLASTLWKQGRLAEAEIHARNAAYQSIRRGGQDNVQAMANLQQLIMVLSEQNRLTQAMQLVERVRAAFERQGLPATAFFAARNQRLHANLLAGQGRWREALVEFEALRALVRSNPDLESTAGAPSLGWVRALIGVGDFAQAVAMAEQMHTQLRQALGPEAYETAEAGGYRAVALAHAGQSGEALKLFREAIAVLVPAAAAQTDRSTRRFARLSFVIEQYLALLAELRRKAGDGKQAQALAGEAFTVADALRGQAVQQAMAASAARAAASSPELAALVRQEQDARQERDALLTILADLLSRPADQVPGNIISQMRSRSTDLQAQVKRLDAEIRRRFPDYADLTTPRPASLEGIAAVLQPGEALLSVLLSEEQAYVWAIPAKGQAAFAAVPGGRQAVDQAVARLRGALDPGDVDLDKLPAFDAAVAHQLYQQLLAPVASGWQGAQHLIVAAGGALGRLPFAVLLTDPAPVQVAKAGRLPFAAYGDWAWLIRQMAVSQLPAASSLSTLRRMRPGAPDRLAFMGFGDPQFSAQSTPPGSKATARAFRATLPRRAAEERPSVDYGQIPALPDTREEILSLAGALKAESGRDVFLGSAASRQQVQAASQGNELSRRRVVAFATHGLLAGEYPGVDQPALALANPGGGQHGLLTLDDILGLRLDADWVILSACNTSAGDGQGGEAVSGLGRGFFYAGSRALLVTHWPVETVSAKRLVVGVFEALSAKPGLGRAAALRQSMLQVMASQGQENNFRFSYAHPMFWAPYALVGDGGR